MTVDPAGGATLSVSRLVGLEAIRHFEVEWERLVDADPQATFFQSPQLFRAWHHAGTGRELPWLLVAKVNDRTLGCAAMVLTSSVTRGIGTRVLSFANPRADFVACERREEVIAAICEWLQREAREWDVLCFNDVRTSTAAALQQNFGLRPGFRCDGPWPAPAEAFLDTRVGWDEYLKSKTAHFRKRLKQQTCRVERLGSVRVRRYKGPSTEVAYDEFLRLGSLSWKANADSSRLPQREGACFRELVRASDGRIQPDIMFLDVDDRSVAAILSLAHRHTYYLFLTYFDDSVRAFYPGRRLLLESIQHAFDQPGIRELSFVGAFPFALSWCNEQRGYSSLKIYGKSLRARWARSFSPQQPAASEPAVAEADHV